MARNELGGLPLFDAVSAAPSYSFTGSDETDSINQAQQVLKLPDLIAQLAQEAEVLVWDDLNQWYEVIDSQGFEARFNALRYIRGKRNEEAADRPFARMHVHFVLVRGEKWAGNGSAFRAKSKALKYEAKTEPNFNPKQSTRMTMEIQEFSAKRPRMYIDSQAESSNSEAGVFHRQDCEYSANNYSCQV
jgi:hypothetical protein